MRIDTGMLVWTIFAAKATFGQARWGGMICFCVLRVKQQAAESFLDCKGVDLKLASLQHILSLSAVLCGNASLGAKS